MGQTLFSTLLYTQLKENTDELLLKTAHILALDYIKKANALCTTTPPHKPLEMVHTANIKSYLLQAIYFAKKAIEKCQGTLSPGLKVENNQILAYCFQQLEVLQVQREDISSMSRVLGLEQNIPKITEECRVNKLDLEKVLCEELTQTIQLEKNALSKQLTEKGTSALHPTLPTEQKLTLESIAKSSLDTIARQLAIADPITGRTGLHRLAEAININNHCNILQQCINLHHKLIKDNEIPGPSAVITSCKLGLLPQDVAIDERVRVILSASAPSEYGANVLYWYEPKAGIGLASLGCRFAIDAPRKTIQLSAALIKQKLSSGKTLGSELTPIEFRSAGLEYDQCIANPPKGEGVIDKIVILDNQLNDQAAHTFSILVDSQNQQQVHTAVNQAFRNLGLTPGPKKEGARGLLVAAIRDKNVAAVKALLSDKDYAEVINLEDHEGNTPLSLAVNSVRSNQEIACLLVNASGNPTQIHRHPIQNGRTTPFRLAVYHKHPAVVEAMLKVILARKLWTPEKLQYELNTAVFFASSFAQINLMNILLSYGADPNAILLEDIFISPYSLLLDQKSLADYKTVSGDTAFHWALARTDSLDVIHCFSNHPVAKTKLDFKRKTVSRMMHHNLPNNIGIQVGADALAILIQASSYKQKYKHVYHKKIRLLLANEDLRENRKEFNETHEDDKTNAEKLTQNFMSLSHKTKHMEAYLQELNQKDTDFSRRNKQKRGNAAYGLLGKNLLSPENMIDHSIEHFHVLNIDPADNASVEKGRWFHFLFNFQSVLMEMVKSETSEIQDLARLLDCSSSLKIAKNVLDFFKATSDIKGWQYVEAYCKNPQAYIDKNASPQRGGTMKEPSAPAGENKLVLQFESEGTTFQISKDTILFSIFKTHAFMRETLYLFSYLLNLIYETPSNYLTLRERIYAFFFLQADKYRTQKETQINLLLSTRLDILTGHFDSMIGTLLTNAPPKFNAYRQLQKKGISWPHSPVARRSIEKAGFKFEPMMIRRDRCVCVVCGVEVSGWRPWSNPWSLHDYEKHKTSKDLDFAQNAAQAFPKAVHDLFHAWSQPTPFLPSTATPVIISKPGQALTAGNANAAASPAASHSKLKQDQNQDAIPATVTLGSKQDQDNALKKEGAQPQALALTFIATGQTSFAKINLEAVALKLPADTSIPSQANQETPNLLLKDETKAKCKN